jgi:hypothetical protein
MLYLFSGATICVWPISRLTDDSSAIAVAAACVMGVLVVRNMVLSLVKRDLVNHY